MQIISERPTCMACKKHFMGSTKEKWRLVSIQKVKDILKIDSEIKEKYQFGLFCGVCIQKLDGIKNRNV